MISALCIPIPIVNADGMSEQHSEFEIPELPRRNLKTWARWTRLMPWMVFGLAMFVTFQLWQASQLEAERNLRISFQARVDDSMRC